MTSMESDEVWLEATVDRIADEHPPHSSTEKVPRHLAPSILLRLAVDAWGLPIFW
jgi:hypothetical protein